MSNNLEIVMDIDTLDIFGVIDLDEQNYLDEDTNENSTEERKTSSYDDLDKIRLENSYYYKPSSLLWEVIKNDISHDLSPRNKHGTYSYYQHSRDGTWGHVKQHTQEEALWKALELNPEMMAYV
ncbi:hypothetical protein ACR3IL_07255 [Streptococcus iniae]|nr:hypothetical protein BKX95_06955 [Streptococcus iniae]